MAKCFSGLARVSSLDQMLLLDLPPSPPLSDTRLLSSRVLLRFPLPSARRCCSRGDARPRSPARVPELITIMRRARRSAVLAANATKTRDKLGDIPGRERGG